MRMRGRAHAFAAARQGGGAARARNARNAGAAAQSAARQAFTERRVGTSRGTRRTVRAAQRGAPGGAQRVSGQQPSAQYTARHATSAAPRVTPLEDFHEPAAVRRRASRMSAASAPWLHAEVGATDGRAAADHPTAAAALARLVGPCRWQHRRRAHGLPARTTHRGRARRGVARPQRDAPAAVVVAPALGSASRGGRIASRGRPGRQPRWCGPT